MYLGVQELENKMCHKWGKIMAKREKECSEGYSKLKGSRGRTLSLKHGTRNLEPGILKSRRKDKRKGTKINTSSNWDEWLVWSKGM